MGRVLWNKTEDEILIKYFKEKGAEYCQSKGINRSIKAITNRWYTILRLNGNKSNKVRWTKEEVDILVNNYAEVGVAGCQKLGLNRSYTSIESKVANLRLWNKDSKWTDKENEILIKYYPTEGSEGCKKRGINRSEQAIKGRAVKFKINKKVRKNITETIKWTLQDMQILEKYYPIGGATLCKKNGLLKSDNCIYAKARRLGLKRYGLGKYCKWSEDELQLLKQYYPNGGAKLCQCKGLNRTGNSIREMASRYKLEYIPQYVQLQNKK